MLAGGVMAININLDVMIAKRKIGVSELADKIGHCSISLY